MNEGIYGGVYAAYAFPVAHPHGYISLIHTAGEKDVEIGVIRDLSRIPRRGGGPRPPGAQRGGTSSTPSCDINEIGWKYGLLPIDVETDKGPVKFFMRWSQDRAVDYGRRGKVLIDLDNNRYLIPNLEDALPQRAHAVPAVHILVRRLRREAIGCSNHNAALARPLSRREKASIFQG